MAKVLISLLGTGRKASGDNVRNEYPATDYLFAGKNYKNETFIANPIIDHYAIDKLFLIGTRKSMWDNIADMFVDEGCYLNVVEAKDTETLNEEDLLPISAAIDKKLGEEGSKCIVIDDGENDEQLWRNFKKFLEVMEQLNDGDELYLDITHAFRSASIMSFVMSDFIKNYK